jgi:hypothetical protein
MKPLWPILPHERSCDFILPGNEPLLGNQFLFYIIALCFYACAFADMEMLTRIGRSHYISQNFTKVRHWKNVNLVLHAGEKEVCEKVKRNEPIQSNRPNRPRHDNLRQAHKSNPLTTY